MVTNKELRDAVAAAKAETKDALQLVYDTLNHGQQKKILEDDNVAALFERFGVEV